MNILYVISSNVCGNSPTCYWFGCFFAVFVFQLQVLAEVAATLRQLGADYDLPVVVWNLRAHIASSQNIHIL